MMAWYSRAKSSLSKLSVPPGFLLWISFFYSPAALISSQTFVVETRPYLKGIGTTQNTRGARPLLPLTLTLSLYQKIQLSC
jgi:hypothetical protein